MKLFGQIIRTAVNIVTLPVDVALDTATAMYDTLDGGVEKVGSRTKDKIEKIKEEAQEKD